MKYFYSVADHTFVVELPYGCNILKEQLVQCYDGFRIEALDVSNVLFELSVEFGSTCLSLSSYDHVASVQPTDLRFEVWSNKCGDYVFEVSDETGFSRSLIYADCNFRKAQMVLSAEAVQPDVLLNNAIMLCYAFAGAYQQTLLVHASVPQIGRTAFLFQGLSGTGKSTHSQLWLKYIPQVELLNDDNPVVRIATDGSIQVWGTPWSGKTPCYRNVCCRLGGVMRLEQAPENNIQQLRPLEAFASLLASCSTMIWDKNSYAAICATVEKVVSQVPAYHLKCLPNHEAAELSHQYLCKKHHV